MQVVNLFEVFFLFNIFSKKCLQFAGSSFFQAFRKKKNVLQFAGSVFFKLDFLYSNYVISTLSILSFGYRRFYLKKKIILTHYRIKFDVKVFTQFTVFSCIQIMWVFTFYFFPSLFKVLKLKLAQFSLSQFKQ
eukprot:TRINITY_DN99791_c0_g1_i2.p3 TRINITY_DN99791_c0_g1~~TRINITY_DN99791_c0_g1_i2.p3  ORF type:complete len:133 (-),score=2.35 TRINITY_DN99791_c0_g1_i2:101-499(-)